MGVMRQIYCTVIICCLCLNSELMFAWPSSTLKIFSSTNTTLNRPMTETEISFFGSLSSIAGVISTPLAGVLLDFLGRKRCCILFTLSPVIAWSLVTALPRVEAVLVAIFVSGLSGCAFMIVPVFISELSQENIRGSLTACGIIFSSIGLLLSYILGGFLEYNMMNYVCLTLSVGSLVMLTLVKESPVHLMRKGLEKEAAESICFYRSLKPNSKEVLRELDAIRKTLNPQLQDEEEALKPGSEESKKLSKFQFIKKSKSSVKGLGIIVTLYFLANFQGLIVVQVYSKPLFEEALPNISSNMISILFALVNVLSGFASAYLLDYFGRRPVIIYPSLATFFVCIVLGTQIQLEWGPSWMTVLFMFAYCITTTFGAANVPSVMASEMFLPEVRGLMTMLAVEWGWICNFLILFIFNPVATAVGLGPVFYVFSVISLMCAIFCFCYLPETKGLTVDVIQTVLQRSKQY